MIDKMIANTKLRFSKRRNAAVSEIVATILMVVIVVAMGTVVLAFASNGFTNFGQNSVNQINGQGNRLTEQLVVEQVTFNLTGSTGVNLYVRNVGQSVSFISALYVQFASNSTLFLASQLSPSIQVNPGSFVNIPVHFTPVRNVPYSIIFATLAGNKVLSNAEA